MAFQPTTRERLRIGLYITIEGSWFSHPFPTNTFKIKNEKELETIQGLQKVKLLYDPDQSDPEEGLEGAGIQESQPSPNEEAPPSEPSAQEGTKESASIEEPLPSDVSPVDQLLQRKHQLRQGLQQYQEQFRKAEAEYKEVLCQGKKMLGEISAGEGKGIWTARKMVQSLNELLVEKDGSHAFINLMGSNELGEDFLCHALNVSSLSVLIARDVGIRKQEIENLAMGALFHDIGELKYSNEILLRKTQHPSDSSLLILKKHPKYGRDLVSSFPNFPYEGLQIISQHHERLNGSGYPLGLRKESINEYAKIVMVADEYDELCNHPDPAKRLTPSEALSQLYGKQGKLLWGEAVISLIRQLGVYPPGSLIELNNHAIGLVTNVNHEARLRPIVMIYAEDIPQEEAMILDLAEDDDLTIERSLHPRDVSPEIMEYLNPRRRISYDSSVPESEKAASDPALVAAGASSD